MSSGGSGADGGRLGDVTAAVRAGGYRLEPHPELGTRLVVVTRPPLPSPDVAAALDAPQRATGGPLAVGEDAVEEAERVTGWIERATSLLDAVLAGKPFDRRLIEAEANAGLALLERLDRRRRFRDVLRVARLLVALLLLALRWADVVAVLRRAVAAAGELADLTAEAWAQHELGTVALAGGDREQAAERLERARELHERTGDAAARATTEANLAVLRASPPRRQGSRRERVRHVLLAAGACVVLATAALLWFDATAGDLTSERTVTGPPDGVVLAVDKQGSGDGTVVSDPAGIECGARCRRAFPEGTEVTLVATAAGGSTFGGWTGGGCGASGSCRVTLDAPATVTARFTADPQPPAEVALDVEVTGDGRVESDPPGIGCPPGCSAPFAPGAAVLLTPLPGEGAAFTGWSDPACPSTAPCTITLAGARTITARFEPVFTLTTDTIGPGATQPDCANGCRHPRGAQVELTAAPVPGENVVVTGWRGCDQAEVSPARCVVSMTGDRSVTAVFGPPPVP